MITYLRTKNCGKFSSFWSEEVTGERPSWHGCQDPIRPRHGPATKIPLEGTILAPLSHAVTAILAWPATDFVCPSASNLPHCKRRDKKWQKLFFFHCPTWRKLWSDSPCSLCRAGEISWPTGRKAQWAFPLICGAWIRPTFQRCRTPLGSRWTYGNQSSSKSEKREREDTREEQRGKTRLVQKGEGKEEMSKHQSWKSLASHEDYNTTIPWNSWSVWGGCSIHPQPMRTEECRCWKALIWLEQRDRENFCFQRQKRTLCSYTRTGHP